jgi:V8-like Glu-specific endopeptidase
VLASSPLRATIFDHDDRMTARADINGSYAPIGLVWADKLATGFLVDNCHVLTVQHVFGQVQSPMGREVVFGALIADQTHWTWSWGKVIATGRMELATDYDAARAADWALLKLRQCIGATIGYVTLVSGPPDDLPELQSAGYPSDRKYVEGITIDPACRMHGARRGLWLNDCAALEGNSGSPIFSQIGGRSRLQVYAIQSAAYGYADHSFPYDAHIANVATPVSAILPHIRKFLTISPSRAATGAQLAKVTVLPAAPCAAEPC